MQIRRQIRGGRTAAWALALACAGAVAVGATLSEREPAVTSSGAYKNAFGGSFRLTDTAGRVITQDSLRGKPFAVFFGFTRCPDVCPTTLARLANLRRQMGGPAGEFAVLFVTVDPAHDTPVEIRRYLDLFDRHMIGATGTEAQLKEMRGRYQAVARQVPLGDGGYTVDHSATVFLMGRRGEFVSAIDAHEPDEIALAKLRMAADPPRDRRYQP